MDWPFSLFVKPTGNDANDGASWATAFKTITRAMGSALPYANVYVWPGTYVETVPMGRVNLIGFSPGNAPGGTVIKAPSVSADCLVVDHKVAFTITDIKTMGYGADWSGRGIVLNSCGAATITRWRHGNQEIEPTAASRGIGVSLDGNTENIRFDNCGISDAWKAIYGRSASQISFDTCQAANNWCDLWMELQAGGWILTNVKAVDAATRQNAEPCAKVLTSRNTFVNCDFSESGTPNTFHVISKWDPNGGREGNTFIGCAFSPGTKLIVEGTGNRLIGCNIPIQPTLETGTVRI